MKPKLLSRMFLNVRRLGRFTRLRDVAVAIIMLASCFPVLAQPQTTGIKHNNNPVLDAGPPSAWDGGRIYYPTIFFDGTQYRLWYTGFSPTLNAPPAIGYATSPDGFHWTKHANNPVLSSTPGTFENDAVFEPVVVYDGARFHMWYDGASQSATVYAIGYATSSDGINWTKHPGNPVLQSGPSGSWDGQGVFPSTVLFDGSNFKMWYSGVRQDTARTGYATSSDGIHWTKYAGSPVLNLSPTGAWDSNFLWTPNVHFDGAMYHMWYESSRPGIRYASSSDGIRWTKDPANPIFIGAPLQNWEQQGVGHPRVLFEGNKRRLWYLGADAQTNIRIGYANAALPHDIMIAAIPEHLQSLPILASVAPKVALMNAGLNDESNLSVTCQIDSAGVVVYSDRQELASLQSLATQEVTFKNWRTSNASVYRASFFATRLSNDGNLVNDTLRTTISVSPLMDDFETGFGKWSSATGWGISGQRFRSGRFSMDDSPAGNYANNVNSADRGMSKSPFTILPDNSFARYSKRIIPPENSN